MDDPGPEFIDALKGEELEALVETMYLVAFADGDYAEAEQQHFHHSVELLTAGRLTGAAFEHLIERVAGQLQRDGHDRCVATIKERLPSAELRQVALILASDMAFADGVLHPAERAVITALATSFGVNAAATQEIIDGPSEPSPG